jgi:hypothetical protein
MLGQLVQFGQHVIPEECLGPMDLNYQRTQSEGGGAFVRVHLRNLGTLYGPNVASPPTHLDFKGAEAQAIRRWATRMEQTGRLTTIIGGEEEDAGNGKKAAAGKA